MCREETAHSLTHSRMCALTLVNSGLQSAKIMTGISTQPQQIEVMARGLIAATRCTFTRSCRLPMIQVWSFNRDEFVTSLHLRDGAKNKPAVHSANKEVYL